MMINDQTNYENSVLPEWINNKNIIITGGTTGIGRATALLLASMGNHVLICGHHQRQLDDTLEDFAKITCAGSLNGIVVDLATEDGIQSLFQEFDHMYDRLDLLINNAAVAYQSVKEGTYSDQAYLLRINVLAYLGCSQAALSRMEPHGSGHIVNVGSMSADAREEQREKIGAMEMLYAEDIARSIAFVVSQPLRSSVVSMQVKPLLQII